MLKVIIDSYIEILAILIVAFSFAFFSAKVGAIVSCLLTFFYVALALIFLISGVSGSDKFLVVGIFVFPLVSWVGYFVGRFFGRNRKV